MASSSQHNAKEEDLSNVEFETSEEVEVISTFDQMNLREDLLRGIYAYGERHVVMCMLFCHPFCCVCQQVFVSFSQDSKSRLRSSSGQSSL